MELREPLVGVHAPGHQRLRRRWPAWEISVWRAIRRRAHGLSGARPALARPRRAVRHPGRDTIRGCPPTSSQPSAQAPNSARCIVSPWPDTAVSSRPASREKSFQGRCTAVESRSTLSAFRPPEIHRCAHPDDAAGASNALRRARRLAASRSKPLPRPPVAAVHADHADRGHPSRRRPEARGNREAAEPRAPRAIRQQRPAWHRNRLVAKGLPTDELQSLQQPAQPGMDLACMSDLQAKIPEGIPSAWAGPRIKIYPAGIGRRSRVARARRRISALHTPRAAASHARWPPS